jgi:hypothetical protein
MALLSFWFFKTVNPRRSYYTNQEAASTSILDRALVKVSESDKTTNKRQYRREPNLVGIPLYLNGSPIFKFHLL